MPRLLRVPRKAAFVLAVLAAALAVPGSARAIHAQPAQGRGTAVVSTAVVSTPAVSSAVVNPGAVSTGAGSGQVVSSPVAGGAGTPATLTADLDPSAVAGGLCTVPGIGDIGGLLGFCARGTSGLTGDLNNICSPSLPDPEPANSGIDAMVAPPATVKQPPTLYSQDGVAGDFWAATNLQCSDMTSLIGNNVAGMVFDVAKSMDRVTIAVYQSAASAGILTWLSNVTDRLVTALGNAIYFPYVAVVVIIGAIWLAWQGLIRKRGTRTIEGTVWMVVACAAAIFLIGKPADLTGLGQGVSDGITTALNAAFAKLPSPGPSNCVPLQKGDPQAPEGNFAYTSGNAVVDQNADELWTVLVCKPWLDGELGTANYSGPNGKPTVVNRYGRQLLWAQSIAINEKPTAALISAKQATYAGIAQSIEQNNPAVYPLFQGKQWTTRMEIAFAALFAAVVAGVLILLISVTLILLKLGFLLLLIVGPFFLLIGTHPGFGRVVALRWVEMLIGVLLKQAAVAVVLSVLLYCYALIMGTPDTVLPWALKILMIALVTVAAFIYRKPFQHLFSAVGYGVIGSRDRADADLQRAGTTFRGNTTSAAMAVPGFAAYRAARWARQNPGQAAGMAMAATTGGAGKAVAAGMAADGSGNEMPPDAYSVQDENGVAVAAASDGSGGRAVAGGRGRNWAASGPDDGSGRQTPPPLNLPSRNGEAAPPARTRATADTGPVPASRPAPDLPASTGGSRGGSASAAGSMWAARQAGPGAPPPARQAPPSSYSTPSYSAPAAPAQSGPAPSRPAQPRGGQPRAGRGRPAAPRQAAQSRSSQPPAPRQAPGSARAGSRSGSWRSGPPPARTSGPGSAPQSGQSGTANGTANGTGPSGGRPPAEQGPFWWRPFRRQR